MTDVPMNSSFALYASARLGACAILFLVTPPPLRASPTGSIAGSIKDPSGAMVPNARLTLTNLATRAARKAASDAEGGFLIPQLPPAVYSLVVEAPGFKKSFAGSVLVEVDQITRLDIVLQLGSVEETVEVTGAVPLLEPDRSTLSSARTAA